MGQSPNPHFLVGFIGAVEGVLFVIVDRMYELKPVHIGSPFEDTQLLVDPRLLLECHCDHLRWENSSPPAFSGCAFWRFAGWTGAEVTGTYGCGTSASILCSFGGFLIIKL